MGLDMYLYKKSYVKNWEHSEDKYQITVKKNGETVKTIKPEKVSYIVEDAGQWRKANAIHSWFVQNVQDGNDDCGTYYVSAEKLDELLKIVNTVLASSELVDGKVSNGYTYKDGKKVHDMVDGKVLKDTSVASELLPTTEGFFFGGTDYDEWYIADLKETQTILTEALENKDVDFEYTSSW